MSDEPDGAARLLGLADMRRDPTVNVRARPDLRGIAMLIGAVPSRPTLVVGRVFGTRTTGATGSLGFYRDDCLIVFRPWRLLSGPGIDRGPWVLELADVIDIPLRSRTFDEARSEGDLATSAAGDLVHLQTRMGTYSFLLSRWRGARWWKALGESLDRCREPTHADVRRAERQ
jgi:hypothetical protein